MTGKRIFVGLSGGVDSAVSAALLVRQGYQVEGVYLKYASEAVRDFVNTSTCSWEQDFEQVLAVGAHLGIPVRALNVERAYNDAVVADFLTTYEAGLTPNPDILCNRDIKFGLFLDWARSQGAEAIATGHYARIGKADGQLSLLAGLDPDKDQSYFLYTLRPEILPYLLFPIGAMLKRDVRTLARDLGLPNAQRKDSQGVCFIGDLRVREFLQAKLQNRPGPIMTTGQAYLGQHPGLSLFTIGQRHGFGVGGGTPYYVIRKDQKTHTLIVGKKNDPALFGSSLTAINYSFNELLPKFFRCEAMIRYRQKPVGTTVLTSDQKTLTVTFDEPQWAPAPGQAIVFYRGPVVLGGATIDSVKENSDVLTVEKAYEKF